MTGFLSFEFVEKVIDRDITMGDYEYNLVETKRYMVLFGALLGEINKFSL